MSFKLSMSKIDYTNKNVHTDYGVNNWTKSGPARMSDGRIITDYRQNDVVNNMNTFGIKRDDEYRLMLQMNGAKRMNQLWTRQVDKNLGVRTKGCVHEYPLVINPEMATEELHKYNNRYDGTHTCKRRKDYKASSY